MQAYEKEQEEKIWADAEEEAARQTAAVPKTELMCGRADGNGTLKRRGGCGRADGNGPLKRRGGCGRADGKSVHPKLRFASSGGRAGRTGKRRKADEMRIEAESKSVDS